jgi:ribose/xylose/arabinose/galactoside ABC-type transport system permease subunit
MKQVKKQSKLSGLLGSKTFSLIVLLIAVFAVFTILTDGDFLKPRNIKNFINSMSVLSLLTIGAGCLLVSGQIDLSAGAVGTVTGIVFALTVTKLGVPVVVAAPVSLLIAAGIGAFNALLINRFRTQGFITTMATALVCQGVGYVLTGSKSVMINNDAFNAIGTKSVFDGYLPISVIVAAVLFVVYGVVMSKTKFGQSVYLVGGNPTASFLAGIDPQRVSYIMFVNSSVMGGLAGLLLASRMKAATVQGLTLSQFAGMTAAILGGISFGGGNGGMLGAFLGLLIISAFNNGISSVGVEPYWQTAASGALLLVALSFDFISLRHRGARRGKPVPAEGEGPAREAE